MSELTETAERYIEQAVFGKQMEEFVQSRIGSYLMERINRDYDDGVTALKAADAEDPKAIRTAQNQIRRAEDMQTWILSAIEEGLGATQILEGEEQID